MKRLLLALTILAVLIGLPYTSYALTLIDNSNVIVWGTVGSALYPPADTADDDLVSWWHGTNDIQIGQTDFLAYQFN
jgi:hypothetical protein